MKKRLLCVPLFAALLLAGCANYTAPVVPPQGFIYTGVKHPLTVDYAGTPAASELRQASDKTHFFMIPLPFILPRQFWPSFGWGENRIAEIAEEENISEVSYAEADVLSILMIYTQMEVTVYGQ